MLTPLTKSLLSLAAMIGLASLFSCRQPMADPPPNKIPEPETRVLVPPPILASHCPDDMVFIANGNFCIDIYEAPNKKGAYPFYAQTAYDGVNYCQALGKELCTQDQWITACEGPGHKIYAYGNVYKPHACNDDKTGWVPVPWDLMGTPAWLEWCKEHYKGDPSGSRPLCVSDYGVYDQVGDVEEWVRSPIGNGGFAFVGGYWYNYIGRINSCQFIVDQHDPLFRSYELGLRCCEAAK